MRGVKTSSPGLTTFGNWADAAPAAASITAAVSALIAFLFMWETSGKKRETSS
jgi:hypothetical protein